jgi:hypothetical protein
LTNGGWNPLPAGDQRLARPTTSPWGIRWSPGLIERIVKTFPELCQEFGARPTLPNSCRHEGNAPHGVKNVCLDVRSPAGKSIESLPAPLRAVRVREFHPNPKSVLLAPGGPLAMALPTARAAAWSRCPNRASARRSWKSAWVESDRRVGPACTPICPVSVVRCTISAAGVHRSVSSSAHALSGDFKAARFSCRPTY